MAALAMGMTAFAGEVVFDFTADNYGLPAYDAEAKNAEYVTVPATIKSGDVQIVLNGDIPSSNCWRMWSDGLRAYSKGAPYFTVSTTNGEKVTGVEISGASGCTFALKGTDNNITAWAGEEESVTFQYTGAEPTASNSVNKAVISITVTYGDDSIEVPETPDTPDTPDAPVGTINVAEALALIEAGYNSEATVEGIIISITEISLQYGNATYIIADKASDASGLTIFRGKYLDSAAFTSEDQLKVGDKVVVKGDLTLYGETPEMAANNVILSLNGETTAPENPGTPDNPGTDDNDAIFSEPFSASLGEFDINNIDLPQDLSYVWSFDSKYGAKASAYLNNTNYAAKSRLVSPVIDLTNYENVTLSFNHAINYAKGEAKQLCQVQVAVVDGEWATLTDVVYPESDGWTFVESGEISLKAYEGKKIQLGFLYTSTSTVAPTWEIKDVLVEGDETETGAVSAIDKDENAPVEYFNLQGVRVNAPEKGALVIIRQGNKTTKAVIR